MVNRWRWLYRNLWTAFLQQPFDLDLESLLLDCHSNQDHPNPSVEFHKTQPLQNITWWHRKLASNYYLLILIPRGFCLQLYSLAQWTLLMSPVPVIWEHPMTLKSSWPYINQNGILKFCTFKMHSRYSTTINLNSLAMILVMACLNYRKCVAYWQEAVLTIQYCFIGNKLWLLVYHTATLKISVVVVVNK